MGAVGGRLAGKCLVERRLELLRLVHHQGLAPEDREQLFATAEAGRDAGLQVEFSGTAAIEAEPPAGATELLGVAVAGIVLLYLEPLWILIGLGLFAAGVAVHLVGRRQVPSGLRSAEG